MLVAAYALPRFFVEQGSLLELSPQALTTGQVYGGQKVPFEFRLINKSGAPITDIRIRSTCSCQGVVLDKTSIGSGEIAVVSGTLISPNKAGVFEQRIIVQYRAQTPKYGERNLGTIWTIEGVTTESVVSRNTGEKWSRP